MKERNLTRFLHTFLLLIFTTTIAYSQVGIGTVTPSAQLDIVQDATTDSALEINHDETTNSATAVGIRNSGTGRALNVANLSASSNAEVGRFYQAGNGSAAFGLLIDMDGAATSDGLYINQAGSGAGITNDVSSSAGIINTLGSSSLGVLNDLTTAGGTGSYTDLYINSGTGFWAVGVNDISSPIAGGNSFGFRADVHTNNPQSGSTIYGAAFAGYQYGWGHGILVNHSGMMGPTAEFNTINASNAESTLLVDSSGAGSAITATQSNNSLVGTINVGDFRYTGGDIADHVAVFAQSAPATGWGVGVLGVGNFYGVFSNGDLGASGTKTFIADHPLEPGNKFLKHFSIESDEVLNMYRGVAELDGNGTATVELPDYFEAINTNISYQLTGIGTPQPPYVAEEVTGNSFVVGGAPGTKVSWLIIAERNDAYMQMHPEARDAEPRKEGPRQGKYITPTYYGQPEEKGLYYSPENQKQPATSISTPTVPKVTEKE